MTVVSLIFLFAIAGQCYAKEQETHDTASADQSTDDQLLDELADKLTHSMDDTMVDKLASKLVTKMVDRALEEEPEFHADLDDTTLAKEATPKNVPQKTVRSRAPAPAPSGDGGPKWLTDALSNLASSGGGVTPTTPRQPTRGQSLNVGRKTTMSAFDRIRYGKAGPPKALPEQGSGFRPQVVRPVTFQAPSVRLPIAR
jgi:hypothetical protein